MKDDEKSLAEKRALKEKGIKLSSSPYHKDCVKKCSPSTISVKSKKSSNIISSFVRRAIRRKKPSTTTLGLDMTSNSSVGGRSEDEIELNNESYEKKSLFIEDIPEILNEEQDNSETKLESKTETEEQNLLLLHNCDDSQKSTNREERNFCVSCSGVPTTYMFFAQVGTPIPLANSLQLAQDLMNDLKESENNLIQMFTKFIKDPKIHRELVDVVSRHSKFQWEAERRTSSLVNDMWIQQLEVGRVQERTLQDTLNTLVKQNRQLQIENETLFRRHEKVLKKLYSYYDVRKLPERGCEKQIDAIVKHNEKLQDKLENHIKLLERFEKEMQLFQVQTETLEKQLRNSNAQVQSLKCRHVLLQRSKTDYDLELMSLNNQLEKKEQILNDTVEAGDILLDDLDALQRQMKDMPFSINWSKFKCKGSTVPDLVHLCRSCVNELSKELICLNTKLTINSKDMETLTHTNMVLQQNLQDSISELEKLSKQIEKTSQRDSSILSYEHRVKQLETENNELKEKFDKIELDYKNAKLMNEKLTNEANEKEKMLEEKLLLLKNIYSENFGLHKEVESLNKLIREIGAGDVTKDGADKDNQQLLKDKQHLLDQLIIFKEDNRMLLDNQEKYFQLIQKQQTEVTNINKEKEKLKNKIESEHQTILVLQAERKKFIEEKATLKSIFQHMKHEINRVQKLEGAVVDISKEANRLALIADYNKQIGDKLKDEVVQRDNTISELRGDVEKLNNIQVENVKEKLSLCHELSEICTIKDRLHDILSVEVQKNLVLDETKKNATSQAKLFQVREQNERQTIKDLFKELRKVVAERDALHQSQDKYIREVKELQDTLLQTQKKLENCLTSSNEKEIKLREIKENMKINENSFKQNEKKLHEDVTQYENKLKQLKQENEELQTNVKYLQNNTQKLHSDLNETRKNEKEVKDQLTRAVADKANLEYQLTEYKQEMNALMIEKQRLLSEIDYVNNLCEKVLSDFEVSIKSSVEKEEFTKKEVEEAKKILTSYRNEIQFLHKELELSRIELSQLKARDSAEDVRLIEGLQKNNTHLKSQLLKVEQEYKNCSTELNNKTEEIAYMQKQFKSAINQKEEEHIHIQTQLEGILRKHIKANETMKEDISALNKQLEEISQILEKEKLAHSKLTKIHKEVSTNYFNTMNQLKAQNSSLSETKQMVEDLNCEKNDLQTQIKIVLEELNAEKHRINNLLQEKDDIQKRYSEVLGRCLSLENELRESQNMLKKEVKLDVTNIEQLQFAEQRVKALKIELDESHNMIISLKEEVANFQQQIATLEFQKCELTLRMHETQGKLETERSLCEQLKNANQHILSAIIQMKEEGKVSDVVSEELFYVIQNESVNKE